MFKRLFYFLLSMGGLSPILLVKPTKPTRDTSIYNFCIEPLSTTKKESRMWFSFPAMASGKIISKVYLENDLYPDGILIGSATSGTKKYEKVLTYDNRYTRANNKIRLETTSVLGTFVTTNDILLKKAQTFMINSDGQTISEETPCLYYDSGSFYNKNYTYTFNGFESMYSPEYYHFYSPNNYSLSTTSKFSLSNIEACLYLTNRNGVFDDMPFEDDLIKIPLSVSSKGKLALKDKYYVDPMTLKMSATSKLGYVETSYLYLPKNEMRYQGEYEGIIRFSNFGSNGSKVIYSFKLNALANIMGDCVNSEYCVLNNKTKLNWFLGYDKLHILCTNIRAIFKLHNRNNKVFRSK
mgnify:CR=1 FL=1